MYDANVAMAQIEEDVRFSYNDKDENIINSQRNDWDNNMGENDQKKDQSNTSNSDTLDMSRQKVPKENDPMVVIPLLLKLTVNLWCHLYNNVMSIYKNGKESYMTDDCDYEDGDCNDCKVKDPHEL